MTKLIIKFKNNPELVIQLNDSETCREYEKLFKVNRNRKKPIFRDNARYNKEYLKELSLLVKKELNWNWISNNFITEQTVKLHKDIENLLNKEGDFSKIPGPIQDLLHETHHCIHSVQHRNKETPHGQFLQVEWFNNDYKELPNDAEFKTNLDFGDVVLQNAYVGHAPLQCWMQNDYKNIFRTCAFPDRIKPGFTITLSERGDTVFNWQRYENWWRTHCSEFVNQIGFDKIKYYTGFILIGKVEDCDILNRVLKTNILELEDTYIYDQV